jgi:single-strand DNA-binding protein
MYQKHIIIGYLGQDASTRTFTSGDTAINFSVAATESWKDQAGNRQERTTWYNCSYFTKTTGVLEYLRKGTLVVVEGSTLTTTTYDKAEKGGIGIGVSLNLKVDTVRLLSTNKPDQSTQRSSPSNATTQPVPLSEEFPVSEPATNGNDLPF